ncbi:uncharacterized protein LOC124931520 [Impatiens glandulifera]|uniref:uncharacterized protein LOC124931520 n=1 Tax=Impatiens glandulifera TaxID=253017 RepID=UPI001FB1072E|nr:uncharacterized protein LOC124931520 [Impatiens glandulifera]
MMMMMMAQKNLHELLEQDQEPFLLKNYIADRRSLLKNHLRRRPKDGGVLHISEPTAALLLEAATRIHNQSTKPKSKVGIFDSIFKRFGNRSRKDRIFVEKSKGNAAIVAGNSTVWSEKSLDLETCCSSSSSSWKESGENIPATAREGSENSISSPQSPFRFSLFNTPEFSSPEVSPGRRSKQGNEIHEANTIENYDHQVQVQVEVEVQEEDEKEQFSPVSVLEPRFQDEEEDQEEDKVDDYDPEMECSYAIMQKAKHQLLEKLRRFERLAQLDPFELDKTLFDDEDNEINDVVEEEVDDEDCFFMDVIIDKSGIDGIKRLVSDLIVEEEMAKEEEVTKRVCMRLEKWKESKRESIDMMVEMDLRMDQIDGWKKIDEKQVKEVEKEIGLAILGDLIEELLQDQLIVLC